MKKIVIALLFLFVLLILGAFAYFYYIKPQREFIKINTQKCIASAMAPIDSEVAKYNPNPYKTEYGFEEMLKVQSPELDKCIDNYNSILFSEPERSLFLLNLSSTLDAQRAKISEYAARINKIISENNRQLDKDKACTDMKAEQKGYQDCVSAERKKDNTYYSSSEYMLFFTDFLGNTKGDVNKDICLSKYNYQRFGVSWMSCSF